MWELRWVLLALGVVLIAAVWIWSGRSAGAGKSAKTAKSPRRRSPPKEHVEAATGEPAEGVTTGSVEAASDDGATASGDDEAASDDDEAADGPESGIGDETVHEQATAEQPVAEKAEPMDRVIAIRCQVKQGTLSVERVVLALRAAGLEHGRYDIFHRHAEDRRDDPLFSVANLTEPGSFDLIRASESTTAGITLFMVLPGHGDAVERFDMMTRTAHDLAGEFDAELHDESGSFWSIQRERYVRDEVIMYGLKREQR